MKKLFITYLLTFLFVIVAAATTKVELRNQFYNASNEKISLVEFKSSLDKFEPRSSSIFKGYHAMYFMLLSRDKWNPFSKYSNFVNGKKILEEAIHIDPKNIELRYLRFCIQNKIPNFLNYSMHLKTDKDLIIKSWNLIKDQDLKEKIRIYFIVHEVDGTELFKTSNS